MALPDNDVVKTMDYGFEGAPAVLLSAKPSVDTLGMNYGWAGVPFVAATAPLGPPVGQNGFVAIGCMS